MLLSRWLRYSTFLSIYKEQWADILKFRQRSMFTQCELCFQFKESIAKAPSLEEKLASTLQYRQHLSDQYSDRCITWALQELALDDQSDLCVMMTDGMDQGKYALPRDPHLRASAAVGKLRQNRPRIKVHGLWSFGCLARNCFFRVFELRFSVIS